jgi:putative transposase
MTYNPNIHHRRSIRLKGYDYSRAGAYYITICCQDRACLFGKITHGEMMLNEYGTIAYNEWLNTPNIRKNVELDVFVIMPNHMHGIIILNGRGELHSPDNEQRDNICWGECNSPGNEPNDNMIWGECNSPRPCGPSNTIGAIVRGYKSSVTKQLNLLNIGCVVWQRNYYEHIIRNEQSYQTISEYIINNPAKWKDDKFYNAYLRKDYP